MRRSRCISRRCSRIIADLVVEPHFADERVSFVTNGGLSYPLVVGPRIPSVTLLRKAVQRDPAPE